MALGKAVALAAGGVAAAAIFLCALLIYKLIASRKGVEGGKTRSGPQKAVYDSPRPKPVTGGDRHDPPTREAHPSRPKNDVASMPPIPSRPVRSPRSNVVGRPSPFTEVPPPCGDPTSGSRDLPSTDESVWQCPTREPATGEEWSIGANNYVYSPNEFFISGDIPHDRITQAAVAAEGKNNERGGAVDEWGHRYDAVSSWVEDSKGGGWRPVDDRSGSYSPRAGESGSYSSRINNPLFAETAAKAEAGGQGRIVSSWVEDSAGGGWRPVDREGAKVGQEGSTPGRALSSQGGWRGVDKDGLPSARQMGRVMDSWVEDSQGGGWRPVDKGGLPSARQMGRVMDSWVEDSQGGGWRPVDKGELPSARNGGRVVESWVEDSQGGGWRPVDKSGQGAQHRGLMRPPTRAPNSDAPRQPAADRGRHAVEIPRDEELPVSCSLPGDFDFIHRGSDDWDVDSNMSNTVLQGYALSSPTPARHPQQPRPSTPDLDSAVDQDFSFDQASMDRAKSLGQSISTIEEGGLPEEPCRQDHVSVNMAYGASVPGLKPLPDYRVGKPVAKPVPHCPEPMAELSVSSAGDSDDEMVSPVMGQGRPAPGRRPASPSIEIDVRQMAASEEKVFTSPFFNTPGGYFSKEDQVGAFEEGLSAYSLSSADEIDLCLRSQDAIKRLDDSIWVDNALFDTAPKAGQKGNEPVHGGDMRRARSPALVSM